MNEKKLYHTALSRTLLDGEAVKKNVKARLNADGITETPQKTSRETRQTAPRRVPAYAVGIAAAALVLTLALGSIAGILALHASKQPKAANPVGIAVQAEGTVSSTPEPTPLPAATPVSVTNGRESFTIRLVPELDNPEQYWTYSTFSEEKWGWLRNVSVKTATVYTENNALKWDVQFWTDHLKTFQNPYILGQSASEQCVDIWLDELKYEADGHVFDVSYAIGNCVSDIADDPREEVYFTLGGVLELNAVKGTFPTEGQVTLIETYRAIDYNVDMQANIATLAVIEHRITFDAGEVFGGSDYFPPAQHTEADGSTTKILLLNDIPSDQLSDKLKERRKTFSPESWAWLTEISPKLEIVFYNGDEFSWTEMFGTDHVESFADSFDASDGKQHVLVKTDSITLLGAGGTISVVAEGKSGDFSQNGQVLVHSSQSEYFKNGFLAACLWEDPELTVTTRYCVLDHTAGENPDEALVAIIEHTFTVNRDDIFKFYGSPASDITGIGMKYALGSMTLTLDELHFKDGDLTAVLSLTGADWAAFPANLAFRRDGRSYQIPGTVSAGWENTEEGRKTISISFTVKENPLWPQSTMILSGSLEGNNFEFTYACPAECLIPADLA